MVNRGAKLGRRVKNRVEQFRRKSILVIEDVKSKTLRTTLLEGFSSASNELRLGLTNQVKEFIDAIIQKKVTQTKDKDRKADVYEFA